MAGTNLMCAVYSDMCRNYKEHCFVRCQVFNCGLCSCIFTSFKKFEIWADQSRKGTLYSAHQCDKLCWRVIRQDLELKSRRIKPAIKLFEGTFIAIVSPLAGSSWKKVGLCRPIPPNLLNTRCAWAGETFFHCPRKVSLAHSPSACRVQELD